MKRPNVEIINRQKTFEVTDKLEKLIKKAIATTLGCEGVGVGCEVSVQLTNNRQRRELNAKMRNISGTTDVLSFPSGEYPPEPEEKICFLGDISLNLERAEKQRKAYGHSFEREVAFLTAHSCLHLLGYDHISEEDEKEMIARQKEIMEKMGLGR